jgi:hypothetical protein
LLWMMPWWNSNALEASLTAMLLAIVIVVVAHLLCDVCRARRGRPPRDWRAFEQQVKRTAVNRAVGSGAALMCLTALFAAGLTRMVSPYFHYPEDMGTLILLWAVCLATVPGVVLITGSFPSSDPRPTGPPAAFPFHRLTRWAIAAVILLAGGSLLVALLTRDFQELPWIIAALAAMMGGICLTLYVSELCRILLGRLAMAGAIVSGLAAAVGMFFWAIYDLESAFGQIAMALVFCALLVVMLLLDLVARHAVLLAAPRWK